MFEKLKLVQLCSLVHSRLKSQVMKSSSEKNFVPNFKQSVPFCIKPGQNKLWYELHTTEFGCKVKKVAFKIKLPFRRHELVFLNFYSSSKDH